MMPSFLIVLLPGTTAVALLIWLVAKRGVLAPLRNQRALLVLLTPNTCTPYGVGRVMILDSKVTAPSRHNILPTTTELVPSEFDARAITVPLN